MTNRILLSITNLEALRKEAKVLLKSVKEAEPEALERIKPYFNDPTSVKLTNMQLVVAREFGFESWNKLRSRLADQQELAAAQREVSKIQQRINSKKPMSDRTITQADTTLFARQVATMFKIGIPLVQSLEIVANDTDNAMMREVILKVRETISANIQLHIALREHPDHFSDLYCKFVETGEKEGALDKTLDYIADYQDNVEKQQQLDRLGGQ